MSIVNLPLPYQLTNGTVADSTQVMADLNYIANSVNANVGTQGRVYVSATSTLLGYLAQVLVAGSGVTLTTLNPGGAEQLQVTSTATSVALAQVQAACACI